MDFITELLDKYDEPCLFERRYLDTITLAYEHLNPLGIESMSLDSCRRFFGWSNKNSHTALQDAKDCKRLFYTLLRANRIKRWSWIIGPRLTSLIMLWRHKKICYKTT